MKTQVSIFIPSYNQARFLNASVGSALTQLDVTEILISDDKSTDESLQILHDMARQDSRLKVLEQVRNRGIPGNIDVGLRACRGEYILRLDADDCLLPEACTKLLEALLRYPEAGVAHGQVWEIDEGGSRTRHRLLVRKPGFQTGRMALAEAAQGYRVTANILMFRREALETVHYLNGRPSFAEDYHLFAALAAKGWGNVYIGADVAEYRSYTSAARAARKSLELQGLLAVFNDVLKPAFRLAGLPEDALRMGRRRLAYSQARYLLEATDLTRAHERELRSLLRALHASAWPSIYLAARRFGLARYVLAAQNINSAARRHAKAAFLDVRQAFLSVRS